MFAVYLGTRSHKVHWSILHIMQESYDSQESGCHVCFGSSEQKNYFTMSFLYIKLYTFKMRKFVHNDF